MFRDASGSVGPVVDVRRVVEVKFVAEGFILRLCDYWVNFMGLINVFH